MTIHFEDVVTQEHIDTLRAWATKNKYREVDIKLHSNNSVRIWLFDGILGDGMFIQQEHLNNLGLEGENIDEWLNEKKAKEEAALYERLKNKFEGGNVDEGR